MNLSNGYEFAISSRMDSVMKPRHRLRPSNQQPSNQQQSSGAVNCARFNRAGDYCLTGGHDRQVRLWRCGAIAAEEEPRLLKVYAGGGHIHEVLAVCVYALFDL